MSMVGSLIVDFGSSSILVGPFPYYKVMVNGSLRYSHTKDTLSVYSTHISNGDIVLFEVYNLSGRTLTFDAKKYDFTTDNEGLDFGIKETTLTGFTTSNTLTYSFTATTVASSYNFEYKLNNNYNDKISVLYNSTVSGVCQNGIAMNIYSYTETTLVNGGIYVDAYGNLIDGGSNYYKNNDINDCEYGNIVNGEYITFGSCPGC